MKLITRTTNIKNHVPTQEIVFPNSIIHQQPDSLSKQQKQIQYQGQQKQQSNNLHNLQVKIQSPANSGKYMYDKSITTHLESNHVYDSVKNRITNSHLTDWKLLTLKQLHGKNHPSGYKQGKIRNKNRGICVSLSNQKRNPKSREKQQKKQQEQVYKNHKSPYFKCLSSLSKKSQLIDQIQSHLEKKQQRNYFC